MNEGNYKALYRKAKSLKELGRHQEAYEAVAKCSLGVPQVRDLICFSDKMSYTCHKVISVENVMCISSFQTAFG